MMGCRQVCMDVAKPYLIESSSHMNTVITHYYTIRQFHEEDGGQINYWCNRRKHSNFCVDNLNYSIQYLTDANICGINQFFNNDVSHFHILEPMREADIDAICTSNLCLKCRDVGGFICSKADNLIDSAYHCIHHIPTSTKTLGKCVCVCVCLM